MGYNFDEKAFVLKTSGIFKYNVCLNYYADIGIISGNISTKEGDEIYFKFMSKDYEMKDMILCGF